MRKAIPYMIFVAVFALYAQTGSYESLRFDDQDYTFLCPFVKDGLSWANVKAAFATFTHAAIWMPLTYVSYMIDISLFGPGPGAHHLVNAAIHAANSALLHLLLSMLFSRRLLDGPPCKTGNPLNLYHSSFFILLSSLFWALHPMRVEPVAWIAGRKELLCAFWTLLGLIAVVKMEGRRIHLPTTIFCCLAACMSKPTGMCFPFLALCVAAMARRRLLDKPPSQSDNRQPTADTPPRPPLPTTHYPLSTLPIAVITGLIAVYSQTHAAGYDVRALFTAPFSVRALNALKSLGLYVFKTFIPFDLHIDCRWPAPGLPVDGWIVILAAVAGLAIVALWLASGIKARAGDGFPLAAGLFLLFAIAPTLGIFGSFGREARADRFMYIPSMAISMLIAATSIRRRRLADTPPYQSDVQGRAALRRGRCGCDGRDGARPSQSDNRQPTADTPPRPPLTTTHYPLTTLLILLLICHSICTLRLIPSFRNTYTAFSRVLACDPIHPRALSQVAGEECARFHDFDSGIKHFRDSLACEWNQSTACQLAFALATRGRREDIPDIRALGESTGIAKNPEIDRSGLMCEALGMSALKESRWLDAVPFFAAAVRAPARLNPPDDAYARLGVALANGGRRAEAEQLFVALARSGAARETVRSFAERSLEQLAASPNGQILLFY